MRWQISWSERAIRDADRLDPQIRQRLLAALDRYATAEHGDVLRLEAVEPPEWRLRVGAWRIRFRRDPATKALFIMRVLPRDKAYR